MCSLFALCLRSLCEELRGAAELTAAIHHAGKVCGRQYRGTSSRSAADRIRAVGSNVGFSSRHVVQSFLSDYGCGVLAMILKDFASMVVVDSG